MVANSHLANKSQQAYNKMGGNKNSQVVRLQDEIDLSSVLTSTIFKLKD